jgi:hypothetical protein
MLADGRPSSSENLEVPFHGAENSRWIECCANGFKTDRTFAGDLPAALAFSRTFTCLAGVIEALIGPGTAHEGSAPFSILTTIFAAAITEPVADGVLARDITVRQRAAMAFRPPGTRANRKP